MATGPLVLYENRLRDAVPVASSTAAGFDVLNLRDLRDYTFWKPSAIPATVTVDCLTSKSADYLAVYGHDLFTTGCTIEVRKSTDNFVANDVLVATHTPTDNQPILVMFTSTASRYWRIRVLTGTAPSIAIALVGIRLEIPAGVREGFDPIGRELVGQMNRSNAGRALGRVLNWRRWKTTLHFELVTWTWVRDTWKVAAEAWLESEPWLFCWHPDTYPKETRHISMDDAGWDTQHRAGSYCDLVVPVTGVMPA
ncbi:MAG TPA: hypothetical protein VJT81_06545 [Burkholderiales bacterium]|nr:hypothetical protein [Burkholderiales bacterium]